MRRRRLWGVLLACGVTASLLTSPTSAATPTALSSATSGSSGACAGGAQEAETMNGHSGTAILTNTTTRTDEHYTFYAAAEGASTAMRVKSVAGCYDAPEPDFARTRVRYTTDQGSATPGTDYVHVTAPTTPANPPESPSDPIEGQTDWLCADIHELGCTPPRSPNDPPTRPTPVTLLQSPGGAAVESFQIRLTAAQIDGSNGMQPFSLNNTSPQARTRTVHIVDDDGASRFSLQPTLASAGTAITYSRPEVMSSIELWLPVFHAGSSTTATQVGYTLSPTGEHPATEGPAGASGTDYTDLTSGTVQFPSTPVNPPPGATSSSARLGWIKLMLKLDGVGEHSETFDVNLVGHNNAGGAVSTRVTILDSNGGPDPDPDPDPPVHPTGKFHHPKLNFKYPQNYPYLNEIHLFTANAMGVDYDDPDYDDKWRVEFADLALRKRLRSGACNWWTGSAWQGGGCSDLRWFRMKRGGGEDYFLYRMKNPLTKSVGPAPVRDYKAWGRWTDISANESELRTGKNMNLFEVIPPTKACRDKDFPPSCKPIRPKN